VCRWLASGEAFERQKERNEGAGKRSTRAAAVQNAPASRGGASLHDLGNVREGYERVCKRAGLSPHMLNAVLSLLGAGNKKRVARSGTDLPQVPLERPSRAEAVAVHQTNIGLDRRVDILRQALEDNGITYRALAAVIAKAVSREEVRITYL